MHARREIKRYFGPNQKNRAPATPAPHARVRQRIEPQTKRDGAGVLPARQNVFTSLFPAETRRCTPGKLSS